jgi:hypothetical protein
VQLSKDKQDKLWKMATSITQDPSDWDDTALQTSWNEAYAEYQKYHSLAAQNLKVDPSTTTPLDRAQSTTQNQQSQSSQPAQPPTNNNDDDEKSHIPLNFIIPSGLHPSAPVPQQGPAGKFPARPTTTTTPAVKNSVGLNMPSSLFSGCGATGGSYDVPLSLLLPYPLPSLLSTPCS